MTYAPPRVRIADCIAIVARHYRISEAMLTGESRERRHAHPRQLAMWLARDLTNQSTTQIGAALGNRDHTTVIHACKAVHTRHRDQPDYAALADSLRTALLTGAVAAHHDYLAHAVFRAQLQAAGV